MKRCKYLDDLGLKVNQYGTNFTANNDSRKKIWSKERKEYGFDSRETWNLDKIFVEWIYTRLMMYKEYANIDMNYHKVLYKDEEMTQEQIINRILEISKEALLSYPDEELWHENIKEICDLWKEILPFMWW